MNKDEYNRGLIGLLPFYNDDDDDDDDRLRPSSECASCLVGDLTFSVGELTTNPSPVNYTSSTEGTGTDSFLGCGVD